MKLAASKAFCALSLCLGFADAITVQLKTDKPFCFDVDQESPEMTAYELHYKVNGLN